MSEGRLSYRDTGVDLDAAERAKERLKGLVASTRDRFTLSELGSFGGLYQVPDGLATPVLVSSADGVGTKLKVAFEAGRHDTVGQCLVNHCVDDILVQGAKPLFFLDYLATGAMDEIVVSQVVSGAALACRENGCALLGGETAQMPDFYAAGEYDLAGFIVGVVEKEKVLDGRRIQSGDVLLGLASSGLHTNGYTLARRIVFDVMGLGPDDEMPGTGRSVADELLAVHRSYLPALWPLLQEERIHGLAHITGGGIPGNLPRVLPEGLGAFVDRQAWEVPPVFRTLQERGDVDRSEMDRVFNMGIGMIAVVQAGDVEAVAAAVRSHGIEVWRLGAVEPGSGVRYLG
ncbi:MAG TPA: phosphoribosylformylglycinamidine cyclo-ligase [Longimicrobiales bacterium]|nr:phosphoribosylformylglycinamidine cyclo-ligase [Longimicrobiales bacterium]